MLWVSEGNTDTSYLYTSKEFDVETGLYYYGARYYDPRVSVWVSADPIIERYLNGEVNGVYESTNLSFYAYGRNNPVKLKDIDGNVVPVPPMGGTPGFIAGGGVATGSIGGYQPATGVPKGIPGKPMTINNIKKEIGGFFGKLITPMTVIREIAAPLLIDIYMYNKNARELDKNMKASGMTKPDNTAAHHIVQAGDRRHTEAQKILEGFGIDINDAANGVYLPNRKESEAPGANHNSLHTNDYRAEVTSRLRQAESKSDAIEILNDIRQDLLNGETYRDK